MDNYPDGISDWTFINNRPAQITCDDCGSNYSHLVHDELEKKMVHGFTCHHCLHYNGAISEYRYKHLEQLNEIKMEVA